MNKHALKLDPADEAFVSDKVESGEYETAADVVSAGLQALRERDGGLTQEQIRQALEAHDHVLAHPETARSSEQVMARIREHHRRITGGE